MTLDAFVEQWLRHGPVRPPLAAHDTVGGNVGLTLYRDDRFQVQLWTLPPGSVVSDHRHPAIDTWLVRVSGRFDLIINGKSIPLREMPRTQWLQMRTWKMHIAPGDWHGVLTGDTGGSFLSISERLDGAAPASVHLSWDGQPIDAKHQHELETV